MQIQNRLLTNTKINKKNTPSTFKHRIDDNQCFQPGSGQLFVSKFCSCLINKKVQKLFNSFFDTSVFFNSWFVWSLFFPLSVWVWLRIFKPLQVWFQNDLKNIYKTKIMCKRSNITSNWNWLNRICKPDEQVTVVVAWDDLPKTQQSVKNYHVFSRISQPKFKYFMK